MSLYFFQTILLDFTVLSFYIYFLISLFLIYPYKLFNMQLGPSIIYLACARLIVPFAPFNVYGCLFWSNGILSEKEINLGVRSYIAKNTTRIWRKWFYNFMTLIYELGCFHIFILYIYYNWSRRKPVWNIILLLVWNTILL